MVGKRLFFLAQNWLASLKLSSIIPILLNWGSGKSEKAADIGGGKIPLGLSSAPKFGGVITGGGSLEMASGMAEVCDCEEVGALLLTAYSAGS